MIILVIGSMILAFDPVRYSGQFRNAQRIANAQAILTAVERKIIDNNGIFRCDSGKLPWGAIMKNPGESTETYYNMAPCLVPDYMRVLPYDPEVGHWNSMNDYLTGYQVGFDPSSGQVTVTAPNADPPDLIHISR